MELISPELALVDPDLARRARARLPDPATPMRRRALPPQSAAAARDAAPFGPVLLVLFVSLAVNGFALVGFLTGTHAARTAPPAASRPATPSAVEQRLLELVVRRPNVYLPPRLIDTSSGLPKQNLQAVCKPTAGGALACDVRLPGQPPGVRAVYREGLGFTWFRPASG